MDKKGGKGTWLSSRSEAYLSTKLQTSKVHVCKHIVIT